MNTFRTITASLIVPFMRVSGFRFSKAYRQASSGWRYWVYLAVDTVGANMAAG